MKLPHNPEDRERVMRAVIALVKLPPHVRREIIDAALRKRGLWVNEETLDPAAVRKHTPHAAD